MIGPRLFLTYLIVGVLTGFLVTAVHAENVSTFPLTASAVTGSSRSASVETYESDVSPQPSEHRDPVYVWQGNRVDEHAAHLQGSADLPQAIQLGGVRYLTGGIGDEERDALNAVKGEYNLHVTSTNTNGEFNGDTMVSILDRSGKMLLNVMAGPLFYADLPPGTYIVKALSGGITEERKVTVGTRKSTSVYFRW